MAILFDPWESKAVPQDSMPSPILPDDIENGDYIVHIENGKTSYKKYEGGGGGGSALIANMDLETFTLDKTWQEIHDADVAFIVIVSSDDDDKARHMVTETLIDSNNKYCVNCYASGTDLQLVATSADGYPVAQN